MVMESSCLKETPLVLERLLSTMASRETKKNGLHDAVRDTKASKTTIA